MCDSNCTKYLKDNKQSHIYMCVYVQYKISSGKFWFKYGFMTTSTTPDVPGNDTAKRAKIS